MAQVSKYPVSKDVYNTIFGTFLKTIATLGTKREVSSFFQNFLTPTERVMLAKRLAIGLLLAKGYSYEQIGNVLRVSSTTIGRVSLYKDEEGYNRVLRKILREEKLQKFLLDVGESTFSLLATGKSKSETWRYLKEEIRKKKSQNPL